MDNAPFVFISYAHRNQDIVLPCVEAMKKSGINLWYDSGIEAGSEWPEFIAQKVASCTKFVLFVSKAYIESQNCKRELNFAISRKKDILSVFVEDVELPLGMEMQLGSYQAIHRDRFSDDTAFQASLANERYFAECRAGDIPTEAQPEPAVSIQPMPATEPAPTAETSSETPSVTEPQELPTRNRILILLISYFGGFLGLQKLYLKQLKWFIIYAVFFWTGIPTVLSLIEGIVIFFAPKKWLEKKYHFRFSYF